MSQLELTTKLDGIILHDTFNLSRDKAGAKAGDTKQLHADWDFSELTIEDVLQKAKSQVRIAFQNNQRKNYDDYADGQQLGNVQVTLAGRQLAVAAEKQVASKYAASDFDGRVATLMEITGLDEEAATKIVEDQEAKENS